MSGRRPKQKLKRSTLKRKEPYGILKRTEPLRRVGWKKTLAKALKRSTLKRKESYGMLKRTEPLRRVGPKKEDLSKFPKKDYTKEKVEQSCLCKAGLLFLR